ncbi:MAG TPA: hypothetical protein VNV38_15450 [Stellaceae bacterium]|jgi:hypothetical protein|nr:hypothetical protein [Stellaceae bacterium]
MNPYLVIGTLGRLRDPRHNLIRPKIAENRGRNGRRGFGRVSERSRRGSLCRRYYRYDRNFSNDAAQRFADHIVSLIGTIRF